MAIILDFQTESTETMPDDTDGLSRDRIMKAAAIYLLVKQELLYFDVTEEFAVDRANEARDAYIRQCRLGRL